MKIPSLKLINALVFFLIIGATQYLVSSDKNVSFEQHVQVQQELSQLIANYIQENLPQMTNFKMHSVYTKAPKKGLMEAHFNYSFTTPLYDGEQLATTELTGTAVLKKIKDEPQEWALERVEVEGEVLTFEDPIVITPSKDEMSEDGFVPVEPVDETPAPNVETKKPAPVSAPKAEVTAPKPEVAQPTTSESTQKSDVTQPVAPETTEEPAAPTQEGNPEISQ